MDEPRSYYTELVKSETERQILHINTCIWNLEIWYWWVYLQVNNGDIPDSGGRKMWDKLREYHGNIYITVCKIDSKWEFSVWHRELNPRLCDNLAGWNGEGGETGVQEGGVTCIPVVYWC